MIVALRGIVIDIAQRKSLEAQLQQALKMEAVGQLTGGIAHDFNNILMVMMANVDALEEEESLAESARRRVGHISRAIGRASDLTRSLLAFSRKLPLLPQSVDLNALVVDDRPAVAAHAGRAGRDRIDARRRICGRSRSIAGSSRTRWSISASTRAMPCRRAAGC